MSEQPNQFDKTTFRSRLLMSRSTAALLVIDVQQKLMPLIKNHQRLAWNIRRLIRGADIMGVPTHCTEQYPKGLGSTIPEIADLLSQPEQKTLFSCRDCQSMVEQLQRNGCCQIAMCGIETHVCVQQTAFDFTAMGFDVWIPVDAVGTRYPIDSEMALRRMEQSGITLTTTESALFRCVLDLFGAERALLHLRASAYQRLWDATGVVGLGACQISTLYLSGTTEVEPCTRLS